MTTSCDCCPPSCPVCGVLTDHPSGYCSLHRDDTPGWDEEEEPDPTYEDAWERNRLLGGFLGW